MGWLRFVDRRQVPWEVHPDYASQILYSEVYSKLKRNRATTVEQSNGSYPNTRYVAINYSGMRSNVETAVRRKYRQFVQAAVEDGSKAKQMLVRARSNAARDELAIRRMISAASSYSLQNIDRAVRNGQSGRAAAEIVRDISAETLVIGSAFLTGGASLAAAGAGSSLKGVGTYQDSGSVGAAVLEGVTSFTCGMVQIPGISSRFANGGAGYLFTIGVHVDILSDSIVGILKGEDAKSAIVAAIAEAGIGRIVGHLGDDFIDSLAIPARIVTGGAVDGTVSAAGSAVGSLAAPNTRPSQSRGNPRIAWSVPIGRGQQRELALSYVEMAAMRMFFGSLGTPNQQQMANYFHTLGS